jgi:hypothetical protein
VDADVAARLRRELDAGRVGGAPPGSWVRRPLRHLRGLADRLTGPHEVTCTLFSGREITVVVPEIVGTQLVRCGVIEPQVTRVLIDRLRPGGVMFDVGAQYGYHALIADELVGARGRVVAFEPAGTRSACWCATSLRLRRSSPRTSPWRRRRERSSCATRGAQLRAQHDTRHVRAFLPRSASGSGGVVHRPSTSLATKSPAPGSSRRRQDRRRGRELAVLGAWTDCCAATRRALARGRRLRGDGFAADRRVDRPPRGLGYECLEHRDGGLRQHRRRESYGYDNLFFAKPT